MSTATLLPFREEDFRKAYLSQPEKDCVRVARRGARVEVRDDKNIFDTADDVRLVFTDAEFDEVLANLRDGLMVGTYMEITQREDDMYRFQKVGHPEVELVFTASEVLKFLLGVNARQFDAEAFAA